MNWFTKSNRPEIQRKLERILNKTVSVSRHLPVEAGEDARFDDRSERLTPVILLQLSETDGPPQITTGVTKDMSIEGLGVTTLGTLERDTKYAVGIGDTEEFTVIECRCVRSDPIGYGYYANGLAATDLLNEVDFESLREFARYMSEHPPSSALPAVPSES